MSDRTSAQTQRAETTAFTPVLSGVLQRQCGCGDHTLAGGACVECRKKGETTRQRAAVDPFPLQAVPPIVRAVMNAPGQPLDAATRAFMEPRFGHDLSGVRVHSDPRSAESARAIHARAYTVGPHIAFGPAQFSPWTNRGRRLLAHELTHVLQQRGSGGRTPRAIWPADDPGEREAEQAASEVVNMPAGPHLALGTRPGGSRVQRAPVDEDMTSAEPAEDEGFVVGNTMDLISGDSSAGP